MARFNPGESGSKVAKGNDQLRAHRVKTGQSTTGRVVNRSKQSDKNYHEKYHPIAKKLYKDSGKTPGAKQYAAGNKAKPKPKASKGGFSFNSKKSWMGLEDTIRGAGDKTADATIGFFKDEADNAVRGGNFLNKLGYIKNHPETYIRPGQGDEIVEFDNPFEEQDGWDALAGLGAALGLIPAGRAGMAAKGFGPKLLSAYERTMHVPDHGIRPANAKLAGELQGRLF